MSDRRPLSNVQWVLIIVAILAILFSLGKCSTSTTSPSHSVFSTPAMKNTSLWRQISAEQHEKMRVLLAPYAGSKIAMISAIMDDESLAFATQLDSVFREAGWQTELQTTASTGSIPSVFLRVPKSHIPESKVKEFSNSATDVTLTATDLPPQDLAVLKAFHVLNMDCPLEAMDFPRDRVELRIGSRS